MANDKIKGCGFHHIALRALNYEETLKFYCDVLGFSLTHEWRGEDGRCCMADMGDGTFVEIYEGGMRGLSEDFEKRSGCFFHLAVRTDDVDSAYERAVQAGAVSKESPHDAVIHSAPELPVRIAFVCGPNEEIIEFFKTR